MKSNNLKHQNFLDALYTQTGGDVEAQVSMYDAGAAIGLEKNEAGALAEVLMMEGLVELKTLSGGIGITPEGLASIGVAMSPPQSSASGQSLGDGLIATETDLQMLHSLIDGLKKTVTSSDLDFELLEEIVFDLKTIEVQMLSPKPKLSIIREILQSLRTVFESVDAPQAVSELTTILG